MTPTAYLALAWESGRQGAESDRHALVGLHQVQIGRGDSRSLSRGDDGLSIQIPDRLISSSHAVLERGADLWRVKDCGSKNGTFLNGENVKEAVLTDGDILEIGRCFFVFRDGGAIEDGAPRDLLLRPQDEERGLCSLHPSHEVDLRDLEAAIGTSSDVLLLGPTGTGKEVLAEAIHDLSTSRNGSFVRVNCGAIPPATIESELFGHRQGSFSGATESRKGFFLAADKGTILLDEIGDMPLDAQVKLLRVLQERKVRAVGSDTEVPVDVRVIAATHRDLEKMVGEGTFRQDLFARIKRHVLRLPALCERKEDMGLLVNMRLGDKKRRFSLDAARAIMYYDWPNNIRELANCLERALDRTQEGGKIERTDLAKDVSRVVAAPISTPPPIPEEPAALSPKAAARKERIIELLKKHKGVVTRVAEEMGSKRQVVDRWISNYGIDKSLYRKK